MHRLAEFETPDAPIYLNAAAEGLLLRQAKHAMQDYWNGKRSGSLGRPDLYAMEQQCRSAIADLLGVSSAAAGFICSASDGLNLVANSLRWEPGDEVLFTDLEHPTNVLPWLNLRRFGVKTTVVSARADTLTLDDFATRISTRTRLISVSHVSYKSGFRITFLPALASAAHGVGALLVVDATQSLGRIPVDTAEVDVVVASGYKWLCGVHGSGLIYVRPALVPDLHPSSLGWYSVEDAFTPDRFNSYSLKSGVARLQPGMPNFPAMFVLNQAIRYLTEVGVDNIESSLLPIVRRVYHGLSSLGLSLLTPPREEFWSGIVSFATDHAQRIGKSLAEQGIITWCGDGRVRVSVHLYNDIKDIEVFLDTLRNALTDIK